MEKRNMVFDFLWRKQSDCSIKVRAAAYTTVIRPILGCAACAWDPHLQNWVCPATSPGPAEGSPVHIQKLPRWNTDNHAVLPWLGKLWRVLRKASRCQAAQDQQWGCWHQQATIPAAKWPKNLHEDHSDFLRKGRPPVSPKFVFPESGNQLPQ